MGGLTGRRGWVEGLLAELRLNRKKLREGLTYGGRYLGSER